MSYAGRDSTFCVLLRSVSKRYGYRAPWVLRDLDVELAQGELVTVRGANGAGKSTLLRLLAGATTASSGSRTVRAQAQVAYAPDHLTPPPPFPAGRYLDHHVRIRRIDRLNGAAEYTRAAECLGCAHLLTQPLKELSAGTRQKILLIQTLLGRPDLVVLDEPYSNLDADARQTITTLLRERVADGASVVLSHHGASVATPADDRTWELREGRIHLQDDSHRAPADLSCLRAREVEIEYREADRLGVLVGVEASDRVLTDLIVGGWHITAVGPSEEPGRHGDAICISAIWPR